MTMLMEMGTEHDLLTLGTTKGDKMFNEGSVQHFPLTDTNEDTENDESDGEDENTPKEDTEDKESDGETVDATKEDGTHENSREEDQSGSGSSDSKESD
jgi:hypothetical protein